MSCMHNLYQYCFKFESNSWVKYKALNYNSLNLKAEYLECLD